MQHHRTTGPTDQQFAAILREVRPLAEIPGLRNAIIRLDASTFAVVGCCRDQGCDETRCSEHALTMRIPPPSAPPVFEAAVRRHLDAAITERLRLLDRMALD